MKLHDLRPAKGARPTGKRVGRGHGSGRGKTAGRGTKGQKSRSGASIPAWFEGGQTPLHVRTPKLHGFKNRFRVAYAPINLARLGEVAAGILITPDVLVHDGVLGDTRRPIKILGGGEAPKGITIHAHAFSRSALHKLQGAGSTAQRISWPDNLPFDDEPAEADAGAPAPPAPAVAEAADAGEPEAADAGQPELAEADEADAPDADEPESEPTA